jgi:hypothetical protein
MTRRSALRCAALLAALAFLLPLAALADPCADCLGAASPDCCAPSCCSCCAHGPSVPAALVWGAPRPVAIAVAPDPREAPYPSRGPRDVFHVPKPALL